MATSESMFVELGPVLEGVLKAHTEPFSTEGRPAGTQRNAVDVEQHLRDRASAWQTLIDGRLIEWGRDPSQLEDDGFEAPTGETIARACAIAGVLSGKELPPLQRIVPTPQGGIVFEFEAESASAAFEVHPDGSLELNHFVSCRLVKCRRWRPDGTAVTD